MQIVPIFTPSQAYLPIYSAFVIKNPSLAVATGLIGDLPIQGGPSVASAYGGPAGDPYVILDARRQNLGLLNQDGLDFNFTYNQPTGFGAINASLAGTYILNRDSAPARGAAFTNQLRTPGASRLSLVASLGAKIGNLYGSATMTNSAGYDITPAGTQTHVKSFRPVDLFFSYDLKGTGVAKDLSFTVNLNNVFDVDPPFFNNDPGFANGQTLGRLLIFGVRKGF